MAQVLGLTTPHTEGEEVRQAQRLLAQNPWQQDYLQGTIDGEFGPETARACKRAKFWLGHREADMQPTFGPELRALLQQRKPLPPLYRLRRNQRLKRKNDLAAKAFAVAEKHVGTRETGPNDVLFSRWYGMPGQAWCCMFVTYCYAEAGAAKSFKRGERWSYCWHISTAAQAGQHHLAITNDPRRGDVVVFHAPGFPKGHIGLFDEWVDRNAGRFKTIEGNSADMVARREQSKRDVRAFVRVGA